jgi:hypothetical protein
MIISNVKKVKNENDIVVCLEALIDGNFYHVPLDTDNRHYAEILKQVADGDITIADAD